MRPARHLRPRHHALVIASVVLLLHALALWALQRGLLRPTRELVVPVEVVSEVVEPPRAVPPPPPPQPPAVPQPARGQRVPRPSAAQPVPAPTPAPQLAVPVNPEPAPNAPTAIAAPPAPLPPMQAPVTPQPAVVAAAPSPVPAPAPAPPPAPPRLELPSSDAEYLQNPKPVYPPMSKRLNEQGTVLVRVLIGVDGTALKAEIQQSSDFDRLDQAALATVLKWRYVPGKRGGKPEAMWFTVPIVWGLKN